MSSRLYLRGDVCEVSPIAWRQVSGPDKTPPESRPGPAPAPAPEPAPDYAAQMARLETEYRQKVREAHAAGLQQGEANGRTRAVAEIQPVLDRLAHSIQEISGLRARLRWEAEADVVKLALAIARRVIRRELAADPDALRGLAMAALEKLQGHEVSRVKVHPSQAATLKSCLQKAGGGASAVEIVSDASRDLGSVVFETTRGNLDASVDSQLAEIERGLADRLRKQS